MKYLSLLSFQLFTFASSVITIRFSSKKSVGILDIYAGVSDYNQIDKTRLCFWLNVVLETNVADNL